MIMSFETSFGDGMLLGVNFIYLLKFCLSEGLFCSYNSYKFRIRLSLGYGSEVLIERGVKIKKKIFSISLCILSCTLFIELN